MDTPQLHFSSKSLDKSLSEAEVFNIDTKEVVEGYPPMIEGVPVAYFCDFNQEIDLGGGKTIPLVMNVQEIFVDDEVISDKEKMTISFKPVVRVGRGYAFFG